MLIIEKNLLFEYLLNSDGSFVLEVFRLTGINGTRNIFLWLARDVDFEAIVAGGFQRPGHLFIGFSTTPFGLGEHRYQRQQAKEPHPSNQVTTSSWVGETSNPHSLQNNNQRIRSDSQTLHIWGTLNEKIRKMQETPLKYSFVIFGLNKEAGN